VFIEKIRSGALRAVALGVLAASGCGAGSVKHMRSVPNVNLTAAANEAVVVFLRPAGRGNMDQASIFDVTPDQPSHLVGLVASKRKVAFRTTPGDHLFMVVGESADFMHADLAPGRLYYVRVGPRYGVLEARFSLEPIHFDEHRHLDEWKAETTWVELNEDSAVWASEHAEEIERQRRKYLPEWMAKAPSERPELEARDGD
jgi:hypothetical protein